MERVAIAVHGARAPAAGAVTWADAGTAAVSCTGDGEAMLRAACAHEVHVCLRAGRFPG